MTQTDSTKTLLKTVECSFFKWRDFSLSDRIAIVKDIRNRLLENKHEYARAITTDMNKPIQQALAEVEKCAYLCDYYIENAPTFLKDRKVTTGWSESSIVFRPLGVLLGVRSEEHTSELQSRPHLVC